MSRKYYQSIYHVNENVYLIEEIVIQINGRIMIKINVSVKKRHVCEKDFGILLHVTENGKYLASIMNGSAIMCDEIIEPCKEEKYFNEKQQPLKDKYYIFWLRFY